MKKQFAHRLKDRFAGKELEILRCVRVHGSIATMMRYEVADYICWTKYIDKIKQQFAQGETPGELSADNNSNENPNNTALMPVERTIAIKSYPLGICHNRRELADEMVNAFTDKVVYLKNDNDRLAARVKELEERLALYEDRQDERLATEMLQAIEVINRC
ncbi:MAG: hypothetical protein WCX07_02170 [Dehalococcoidales bacterium]|nr:hypothetical protein [Dehalococcoidales bacterium]